MMHAMPGVTVTVHDDQSRDRMHDLDLIRGREVFGACEVTAAADQALIELWNVANGTDRPTWTDPILAGGWYVVLDPAARLKRLREGLPPLLRRLEDLNVREVYVDEYRGRMQSPFNAEVEALRVVSARRSGTSVPGSIYLTVELPSERSGGVVPDTGDALATWVSGWLGEPEQHHNVEKVLAAGRQEAHLFVILPGFTPAPFEAVDVLMRDGGPLPTVPPSLPAGITHLWLVGTWSTGDVFRWDGSRWLRSQKVLV